jgi:hypothetical protein
MSTGIQQFDWTSAMFEPLFTAINGAMATVVPIGIAVMGIFIGVRVVKRVIFTFL